MYNIFEFIPIVSCPAYDCKGNLPWFSGTSAVWTTCVLFFQLALLGRYFYAHYINSRLSAAWQMLTHSSLLITSLFPLPVVPSSNWKLVAVSTRVLISSGYWSQSSVCLISCSWRRALFYRPGTPANTARSFLTGSLPFRTWYHFSACFPILFW